jgi:hypothetical protein
MTGPFTLRVRKQYQRLSLERQAMWLGFHAGTGEYCQVIVNGGPRYYVNTLCGVENND